MSEQGTSPTPAAAAAPAPTTGQPGAATDAGTGSGTGGQPPEGQQVPVDANAYKELEVKYGESSKEAKRLAQEYKTAQESIATEKARISALEKELHELGEIAKGANPQGYDAMQMRKQYEDVSKDLAQMKEGQALDAFVAANPDAAAQREALRDLGRAFPGKDYGSLWDSHFSAVIAANKVLADQKKSQAGAAPDGGKGTSTGEPAGSGRIGNYTEEQFNKLPLDQRRDILKKLGVREVVTAP